MRGSAGDEGGYKRKNEHIERYYLITRRSIQPHELDSAVLETGEEYAWMERARRLRARRWRKIKHQLV